MIEETIPAIGQLSAKEQLILSTELWNRNAEPILDPADSESIIEFLKKSRAAYLENPDNVISHDELIEKYKRNSA